jgi:hypothetical protein
MCSTLVRTISVVAFILIVTQSPAYPQTDIPPGTRITPQNWARYKDAMPGPMQALFSGNYSLRMPADVSIEVGPTVPIPLPKKFQRDTEQYHGQVRLVRTAAGGYTIEGYVAGLPFPHPSGDTAPYEILYDNYYTYSPHMVYTACGGLGHGYTQDRYGNKTWSQVLCLGYRFTHLSDVGVPTDMSSAMPDIFLANNIVILLPEESKYTNDLQLYHEDPAKDPEVYVFVPSIRRALRLSQAARCAPLVGSDYTADDTRGGLSVQPPIFEARLIGEKSILALVHMTDKYINTNEANFYTSSILFPRPSVGKWEMRAVYVLGLKRLPSMQNGYCYGDRIVYLDKDTFQVLAAELYDNNSKLWKVIMTGWKPTPIPGTSGDVTIGYGGPGDQLAMMWDVENQHLQVAVQYDTKVNEDVPARYRDLQRWATPAGLAQVMQ